MQTRRIGSSEIEATAVGLGTWVLGGWMWGGCDDALAERAVQTALDAGITLVDTAAVYGFGRSEETVGRAIRGRRRDSVVIASKCGLYWSTEPLPPGTGEFHCYSDDAGRTQSLEKYVIYRWLRPDILRRGVEDSLRRLGTDYIDVMQIHYVSDRTSSVADAMGELEKMRDEGKIRVIGISNADGDLFEEYRRRGSLDVDQERYSMLDRSIEKNGLLEACKKNNVSLFAYSPLENGLLTGKLDPDRIFKPGDLRLGNPKFSKENIRKVNKATSEMTEIARNYDLEVGQLALAWILSRYDKAFVLCGARNPEQALSHAKVNDAKILESDMDEIDSILRKFGLLDE